MNIIDYHLGEPEVQSLPGKTLGIDRNISLFFTGRSHHSGINNWEVIKKFVDGDEKIVKSLKTIKAVAKKTREVFLKNQWELFPELLKEEFEARRNLSENFYLLKLRNWRKWL